MSKVPPSSNNIPGLSTAFPETSDTGSKNQELERKLAQLEQQVSAMNRQAAEAQTALLTTIARFVDMLTPVLNRMDQLQTQVHRLEIAAAAAPAATASTTPAVPKKRSEPVPFYVQVVQGKILRLYPDADGYIYFHTSGDRDPTGYTMSDYNFIHVSDPGFESMAKHLYLAAEHGWDVIVRRDDDTSPKHNVGPNNEWVHFHVSYVYSNYR